MYPRGPKPDPRLSFYEGIREHDAATLADSFEERPQVDDPRFGSVDGIEAFTRYVAAVREWLEREVTAAEPVALTRTKERSVEEQRLRLANGSTLGVAIATDFAESGRLLRLRLYYAQDVPS
jgi:hypothetical protein